MVKLVNTWSLKLLPLSVRIRLPAPLWPYRLVVRSLPFQGKEDGAEPSRATIKSLNFINNVYSSVYNTVVLYVA